MAEKFKTSDYRQILYDVCPEVDVSEAGHLFSKR